MRSLLAAAAFLSTTVAPLAAAPPPVPPAYTLAHRTVSTTNPAAQQAFDQGLTMLYAFNPGEALTAFDEATRDDPNLAIAYWGIALAHGININTDYDVSEQRLGAAAIANARKHAAGATDAERGLIEAAGARYALSGKSDGQKSADTYHTAMVALAARFPDDDDILTITAESALDTLSALPWTKDGKPVPGTAAIVSQLQTVLARNPQHIGANHYLIHTLEASPHPEQALDAARRLAADVFSPGAEHLSHMPAHIFMRVGEYHDAGVVNAKAATDLQAYMTTHAGSVHHDYLGHDCLFGLDAFMMSGEFGNAEKIAEDCGRRNGQDINDLRFRRWSALANSTGDLERGYADVVAGNLDDAAKHLKALEATKGDNAKISTEILRARIAAAHGDSAGEIAALERAVAVQDGFGYSEPPQFWFPVRESLGGAYYRAGRYADAERTFRADLVHNPQNPRSLFGLAKTLEREGQLREAATVEGEFKTAWQHADSTLEMSSL